MKPKVSVGAALAVLLVAQPGCFSESSLAQSNRRTTQQAPQLNLSYERFQLTNGLTVLVHEDHSAPLVSVAVYYHVGSKNEPAGATGFAHLFEHLMFNGSEHYDGEWFRPMQEIGASSVNGTTSFDRTEYHETVPTPALDRALWMESDRMGHLLGAIDQAKLDEQRGVVQNEKRQRDNSPYGRMGYAIHEGLFPDDHPYRHLPIGSMADLEAASLDEVRQWFRSYYGPNNAVLVLSGDITPAQAREKVEHFFGDIPPGPTVDAWRSWAPERGENTHAVQYDDVPAILARRNWVVPALRTRESALLDLAARILTIGGNSRLYRELVHDRQVASQVAGGNESFELASILSISITLKPGQEVSVANEAMDRAIEQFVRNGPTPEEMERAVSTINVSFIRAFQTGGAIAGLLAEGELYADDPSFFNTYLQWINSATAAEVQAAARRHLAHGYHQVDVLPRTQVAAGSPGANRSAGLPPAPTTWPDLNFPSIHTATLPNGARLVVVENHTVAAVRVAVQFDAGFAADTGDRPGVAGFTGRMMNEGTLTRDVLAIGAEAERLGATVNVASGLDDTVVALWAVKANLEPSLALWADVVMNPAFSADAIERVRSRQLTTIAHEVTDPESIALRLLPPLVYGQGHPYGIPFTGTGTEASTRAITRNDLIQFRDQWLRPDNATIFVVGDTTIAEIQPLLERALRGWRAPAAQLPRKTIAQVALRTSPRVILIDRPGAPQSLILAGELAPPASAPNDLALRVVNGILGANFTSRLNMNLREDKHWSYGASSTLQTTVGPRLFFIRAPVQTDRTGDSLREILTELTKINGSSPVTPAEMTAAVQNYVRRLPATLETQASVLGLLQSANVLGRPLDYSASLPQRYQALTLADLHAAAREVVHPERLIWIIVGDRAQIEPQIAALNIAPIELFGVDGQAIGAPPPRP